MRRSLISTCSIALGILVVLGGAAGLHAQNIIAADPLDAASEGKAFHLPPGFEAQLVAAEPEIHKPINIAFDDKGRLWVTDTVEYPFPVAEGQPSRDTVKILEDFGADGRARKITTFADNLNIPVGVLPQRGADGHDSAPAAVAAFVEAIRTAPQKLQLSLAKSLAASPAGADALLDAVTAGKASPRLLQDSNLRERLKVSKAPHVDERLAALAANLPAADVTLQNLINDRAKQFTPAKSSAERGQKVFTQNCIVCHSVGGQGAHVGPPLDGLGIRGVPRICEDILDPSRNVDGAFRYNTYVLLDGNVIAAIPRHEEGETLTVADATGKEIQIQKSNVKRVVPSNLSLMPSNFAEVIKPDDFNDLLAYLLAQAK